VDPLAGQLQAFAFDLRKVRGDAGLPTYRALAKVAGYSATTLSEAAGGIRKPTLDVVLAYVGACHGDVNYWQARWEALEDTPGSAPGTAGSPGSAWGAAGSPASAAAGAAAEAAALAPGQNAGSDDRAGPSPLGVPRRHHWLRNAVVPVAATLTVMAVGAFALHRPDSHGCPAKLRHPAFTARTYGAGARVHTGAVRDAPVITTIPAGCTLGFVGYCVGEKIHDNTGGTPDVRWFELSDTEVLASATVHGNPPPGLLPSRCIDDHQGPTAIRLTVGDETLTATGTGLDVVGFAALYDLNGERRWRQIGFTEETTDHPGFTTRWKPATTGEVVIATAACLGGDGPTDIVTADAPLTAGDRAAAANAACSYPP
jgi:hypothetical protein